MARLHPFGLNLMELNAGPHILHLEATFFPWKFFSILNTPGARDSSIFSFSNSLCSMSTNSSVLSSSLDVQL